MANRTFYPAVSYGFARVYLDFRFTCNGASAPSLSTVDGADAVASLSHTGATNIIGVVLKDKFNKVIYADCQFVKTASAGNYCVIDTIANEGSSSAAISFDVKTFNAGGTALNDPANTYDVGVTMAFRNSNGNAYLSSSTLK